MVEIIVPWQPGCPHRERALTWLLDRHAHGGWNVTVAEASGESWCKARAVTPAVEASAADVVVIADADCWTPGLDTAIHAVEAGAAWAIPHRGVFRLTEQATSAVLGGTEPDRDLELCQPAYRGVEGGGITVLQREVIRSVPLDPRFVGWGRTRGQEDESWGLALRAIAGPAWHGKSPLYHLWHPPQPRMTRKHGNPAGVALSRAYRRARGNPDRMRALLDQARKEETSCRSLTF